MKIFYIFHLAQFLVQKVIPQKDGSSSKVKVKVRVNIHGIFSVSSASLVEVHKSEENEEPMETDQHAKDEEVMGSFFLFSALNNTIIIMCFPSKK